MKFKVIVNILLATLILAGCNAERNRESLTKEQGDAILKELQAIRGLLEKQAQQKAPRPKPVQFVDVDIEGRQFLGDESAPVTLVEFTDCECPFCRKFHLNTFPQLKKQYIDTGKLKYVVMDLPLSFHANAKHAANAALCAKDQGKFWELRAVMIQNANKLSPVNIEQYASQLGVKLELFKECIESSPYQPQIDADMAAAQKVGITGTPTFVLGATKAQQTKFKGKKLVGAQAFPYFQSLIEQELKKTSAGRPGNPAEPKNADPLMKSEKHQLQGKILPSKK